MNTRSLLLSLRRAFAVWVMLVLPATHAASRPNLEGVWKLSSSPSGLRPVDGSELPFTDVGRAQYTHNESAAAHKDFKFDLTTTRCSSPGLPRVMLMPKLIRIYQRQYIVTMLFEWNRLFRQIDMRSGPRQKLDAPTMMGLSYGRWEDATLVVDSYDFSSQKLLDGVIPSSEKLQLIERFRMSGRDTLEDRITVKDPEVFTRDWDTVLTYNRRPDALFPFAEDVCLDHRVGVPPPLSSP